MNKPEKAPSDDQAQAGPIFVSYATADRKEALSVCKAIERRGAKCWISTRDVPPGENYQEAIVRSLRASRAMVLIFSGSANNSDEIKKELSLASRYHVPVMALRIEDVEPSDAFAYELSTRQWIDAFTGWDRSIDSLVRHLAQISGTTTQMSAEPAAPPRRAAASSQQRLIVAAAIATLLLAIAGVWRLLRPHPVAAHSMMVRLTEFQRLSTDLPATMPDTVRDEIIAAFSNDGVVGVSTASAAPPGTAPAYALGGTVRRDGNTVRVVTRLTDERSGATLWTNSYNYDADQLARVPRWVAVDAGNIVRCGLFGASTYRRSLPDSVLTDYMQFCHNNEGFQPERGKALNFARKVVAAAPDFSWGWSAVEIASRWMFWENFQSRDGQALRVQGLQAADKAIALDRTNSQAFSEKAFLLDPTDRVGQEQVLKQALAARPLDCACEHFIYGLVLENVGRHADAIKEFRHSTDTLALNADSRVALAESLIAVGKAEEAKAHLKAAADLIPDPLIIKTLTIKEAAATGGYAAAIQALSDPKIPASPEVRAALMASFKAMVSGDASAKAKAAELVAALPRERQNYLTAQLLGALGANREALRVIQSVSPDRHFDAPSWLFYPSLRGALSDPSFPGLAQRLGLMKYWRATHIQPDVCSAKDPPPFCRMI